MKIGVAGCGSIGSRYVAWLGELGAEVAAYDPDAGRRSSVAGQATVHETLQAMLAWKPQRVLVATPPRTHAEVACAAIEAGADVLVEKPIAASVRDADRIVAAAARAGRQAWVVCNMRFHDGPRTLKAYMHRIGQPLFARAHFGHRLSQMRPAGTQVFASSAAEGGGVVLDCIHEIDYLQWLLGGIAGVNAWLGRIGPDPIQAEDYADLRLEFASGVRGSVHTDFLARRKRRGAEIAGTDGTLLWHSEGRAPEACTVTFGDQQGEEVLLRNPKVDSASEYRHMLQAFLADGTSLQTAEEGRRALQVALRALGRE